MLGCVAAMVAACSSNTTPLVIAADSGPDIDGPGADALNPDATVDPDAPQGAYHPTRILATHWFQSKLLVLDLTGEVVQQISIPWDIVEDPIRGVVEDADGRIHVYIGTFSPTLATYFDGAWSFRTHDGWRTYNNVIAGHLAAIGNTVYATDAGGLTAFDFDQNTSKRILASQLGLDLRDVFYGYDGGLYGRNNYDLYRLDGDEFTKLDQYAPPLFAINAGGDAYGVYGGYGGFYGPVYKYPNEGSVASSEHFSLQDVHDIDLAPDGTVVVCGATGLVLLNASLEIITRSETSSGGFCAFGYH